jgi:hypothetical protein
MTRKDYEAIASQLRAYRTNTEGNPAHGCPATISDIVEILSSVFATDNPRFNADKFREATQ